MTNVKFEFCDGVLSVRGNAPSYAMCELTRETGSSFAQRANEMVELMLVNERSRATAEKDEAITCAYVNAAMIAYHQLLDGDHEAAVAILRAAGIGKCDAKFMRKNFSAGDQEIVRKLLARGAESASE